jgi:hypothetical protein
VDAVRPDDHLTRDADPAGCRLEACDAVLHTDEPVTGAHRVSPEPLPDHGEQFHLEPAAMHRQLRPAVTGVQAARLAPDQLTMPVVVGQRAGRGTQPFHAFAEAQLGELTHGVRQQVDPDAERPQPGGTLADRDVPEPGLVQAERHGEAADAGAHDHDRQFRHSLRGATSPQFCDKHVARQEWSRCGLERVFLPA